ncbi:hypothetical protein HYU11_01745 [Candidatus Woesearchaeota archaeon]|nr:hypothetical protein [Candidatus Woesearchaeota archaeon]
MDAQLLKKVNSLAHELKASGRASDSKEAFELALSILEKQETPNKEPEPASVFLGKDSVGAEFRGKKLSDLCRKS